MSRGTQESTEIMEDRSAYYHNTKLLCCRTVIRHVQRHPGMGLFEPDSVTLQVWKGIPGS